MADPGDRRGEQRAEVIHHRRRAQLVLRRHRADRESAVVTRDPAEALDPAEVDILGAMAALRQHVLDLLKAGVLENAISIGGGTPPTTVSVMTERAKRLATEKGEAMLFAAFCAFRGKHMGTPHKRVSSDRFEEALSKAMKALGIQVKKEELKKMISEVAPSEIPCNCGGATQGTGLVVTARSISGSFLR